MGSMSNFLMPKIKHIFIFILICIHNAFGKKALIEQKCSLNQYWVRPHYRSSYVRTDGIIVKASNVKGYCKERTPSFEIWNEKFRSKLPPDWPHKNEKSKVWRENEIQHVLDSLNEIPKELWSNSILGIYRSPKSKDFPNPATSADGIIVLYDSAFNSGRNLTRILTHELAHQIYLELNQRKRESYWYPMNWIPIDESNGIFVARSDGYVQDDGRVSPEEDFANNVEWFLFEPSVLEKTTPHAYKWIKKHFGDNFKLGSKK